MTAAPSTIDAGGYMGDWRRGAPLGRASCQPGGEFTGKLHLRRIRLDSGGYDRGGAYWGSGGWLWEAWDDAGEVYLTGRTWPADTDRYRDSAGPDRPWMDRPRLFREAAKLQVRDQLGDGVRFYR